MMKSRSAPTTSTKIPTEIARISQKMARMLPALGGAGAGGASPPFPARAAVVTPSASSATQSKTRRNRATRGWHSTKVPTTRVNLPTGAGESIEVFLNGVRQEQGRDFRRQGNELLFERELAREGRLGFWRWLSLFLGVAGPYRQNDSVDVVYEVNGRRQVASGLPMVPD